MGVSSGSLVSLLCGVAVAAGAVALIGCVFFVPALMRDVDAMRREIDTEMQLFTTQMNNLWSDIVEIGKTTNQEATRVARNAARRAVNFDRNARPPARVPPSFAAAVRRQQRRQQQQQANLPPSARFGAPASLGTGAARPPGNRIFLAPAPIVTAAPPSQNARAPSSNTNVVRPPGVNAAAPAPIRRPSQPEPFIVDPQINQFGPTCLCSPNNNCPAGRPGLPGPKGEPGLDAPNGFPGTPGVDSQFVQTGVTFEGCFTCPMGEMGAPGAQGRSGPRGMRGSKGMSGMSGHNGRPGSPGEMGGPGAGGRKGRAGAQGEKGEDAFQTVGLPGPKGQPGPPGDRGLPGFTGRNFLPGPPGQIGIPGEVGFQGAQGMQGAPGRAGRRGGPGLDAEYCPCPGRSDANDLYGRRPGRRLHPE